jgi:hypothetical protein
MTYQRIDTMKFHETQFEEYLNSVEKHNIHPELTDTIDKFPEKLSHFGNLIVYGPSGVGKYSQILRIIKKYSPSELKYDKRMTLQTEKQEYIYRISDIHYEIDMALLGCNSTILWHEIFTQIVDIISMKQYKNGIILCKNFHMIHNELLAIFYSYIQQYNHPNLSIQIKFILMTEHLSFLPNSILDNCRVIPVARPCKTSYQHITKRLFEKVDLRKTNKPVENEILNRNTTSFMQNVEPSNILNMKEVHLFPLVQDGLELSPDFFNTICDSIIQEMNNPKDLVITEFRDLLYDILVYNLDVSECVWYILTHFMNEGKLTNENVSAILDKTFLFFKQYNNNYRPIYHLENMFFFIINKINNYPDYTSSGLGEQEVNG